MGETMRLVKVSLMLSFTFYSFVLSFIFRGVMKERTNEDYSTAQEVVCGVPLYGQPSSRGA